MLILNQGFSYNNKVSDLYLQMSIINNKKHSRSLMNDCAFLLNKSQISKLLFCLILVYMLFILIFLLLFLLF